MTTDEKIRRINDVLKHYFQTHSCAVRALHLMPLFVNEGIFTKDDPKRIGKPLRALLRALDKRGELHKIPYVLAERDDKYTEWSFTPDVRENLLEVKIAKPTDSHHKIRGITPRRSRDEEYVIDLCDEVLGLTSSRQHKFDFLRGDTGYRLPVDAYYKELNLVIEYYERQHSEKVALFDKKMTASGISREEQRKRYDMRRAEVLPQYGIRLKIIRYTDFGTSKRIKRDKQRDLEIIKRLLKIE